LRLYDLLRDEPVFVDWYLKTWQAGGGLWAAKRPPNGAFWSRYVVNLAIAWGLAFTGVGLAVGLPIVCYLYWRHTTDLQRYKEWRIRVDNLIALLGFEDGLALMNRAPKVSGFKQFFQYVQDIGGKGYQVYKSSHNG
jgi:hypothetical protein